MSSSALAGVASDTSQSSLTQALTGSTASSTSATDKSGMGKEDFLKLLTTQLRYQDPMAPEDPKDFVAQLAQFSSLEQLININQGVEDLAGIEKSVQSSLQATQANSLVGKTVKAEGNTLTVASGTAAPGYFKLPQDAQKVTVGVYNAGGQLVRTLSLGSVAAGEQKLPWDGKNSSGTTVADGTYTFKISAQDASGGEISPTTFVEGKVTGVQSTSSGVYVLIGDRRVLLEKVVSNG